MLLNRLLHKMTQANFDYVSLRNLTRHHYVTGLLVLLASLILLPVQSARAQIDDDGMLSYSDIVAAGLRIHFNDYLRNVAQSFEGKDRNPQGYKNWPEFLGQNNSKKFEVALSDEYDVRISETWGFLDYQLAFAQVRGTSARIQKQRLLENLVLDKMIDQSIEIYWQGLIAKRYQADLRFQQARISRILRDSRLSNVTNPLLPDEERNLVAINNQIMTTLRFLQTGRNRLHQFIGYRQDFKIRAMPIGIPVNYYDGTQLDKSSFRAFAPFATAEGDAAIFRDEKQAYTEIQRLFPSVQFAIFSGTNLARRDIVRWHNYSAQLGWNLSNIFKTYPLVGRGITREHARSSAMAMVARNRIGLIEYRQNLSNFEKALSNYNNALWEQANSTVYEANSVESIATDVKKILAAIDSSSAFGTLQQSYYRLLLSGGYVQVDNIDPRIDERSLANLVETGVERLLITDSLQLGSRIERSVLSEYTDNPDIIRILQVWQQSLVLILASNNGTQKVQAEEVLPYLQDNIQQVSDDSTDSNLVDIVNEIPEYTEISKQEAAGVGQNDELLSAIEKVSAAATLAVQAADKATEAADRATEAANLATQGQAPAQAESDADPVDLLPVEPAQGADDITETEIEPETEEAETDFEFGKFD